MLASLENTGLLKFICNVFSCWGTGSKWPLQGEKMDELANNGGWCLVSYLLNVGETQCDVHLGQGSGLKMRCWDPSWHLGRAEADNRTLRSLLDSLKLCYK